MISENNFTHQQMLNRKWVFFLAVLLLITIFFGPFPAAASGFRITNQSLGAVGLASAHIAYTPGPDASYYNPANMCYSADTWQVETSLTFLKLPSIQYQDNRSPQFNGSSENELFFMPLFHTVSPRYDNVRFGFSLTQPYGLAKQWQQPFPRASAEQFSLLSVEANPTLAYELADWASIGGGIRVIYGNGEVKSSIRNPPFSMPSPLTQLSRFSEGTDTKMGYNLALTIRPKDQWTMAATYRSEVTLDLSGDSDLKAFAGTLPLASYSGNGTIGVTLPAVFNLATSYTIDRLSLEAGWDRTFWSSFKDLNFSYNQNFLGTIFDGFDRSISKNWTDTDAYRIGLTYTWSDLWTTTLGFASEQTPVPDATLGFELPDSNALVYCAGVRYRFSPTMEWGLSYMYHHTKRRSVTNMGAAGLPGIDGTFTEGGAHAVTIGVISSF